MNIYDEVLEGESSMEKPYCSPQKRSKHSTTNNHNQREHQAKRITVTRPNARIGTYTS